MGYKKMQRRYCKKIMKRFIIRNALKIPDIPNDSAEGITEGRPSA